MRLAAEKFFNPLGDFGEMHRRAVTLEREIGEITRVLDAHVRRLFSTPFAERILADAFRDEEPARHDIVGAILHTLLFEMFCEQLQEFVFRREAVHLERFVQRCKRLLHLLGKLFIDVPTRFEIGILAAEIKMMTDGEKKHDVIMVVLALGNFAEHGLFGEDPAKRREHALEVFERLCVRFVCIRIANGRDAVVFYLADAFTRDAVLLPNCIERAGLAFAGEAETVNKHAARAIRKLRKELFCDTFYRK